MSTEANYMYSCPMPYDGTSQPTPPITISTVIDNERIQGLLDTIMMQRQAIKLVVNLLTPKQKEMLKHLVSLVEEEKKG